MPRDPVQLRGEQRYAAPGRAVPESGRAHPGGSVSASGTGAGGPADDRAAVPAVRLHRSARPGPRTKAEGLARAYDTGVVCTDERLLHPDPYPSREAWCQARVELTERRLAELDPALPAVLVNHCPLVREPTRVLRYPEFAQWCGTDRTADWHVRYRAAAVVYGHLHIPRTTWYDGVPFRGGLAGLPAGVAAARPGDHPAPGAAAAEPVGSVIARILPGRRRGVRGRACRGCAAAGRVAVVAETFEDRRSPGCSRRSRPRSPGPSTSGAASSPPRGPCARAALAGLGLPPAPILRR